MNEERKKLLLDATAGIREEYIEEAATAKPVKTPWLRVAAIAAVLAIVIGGLLFYKPAENVGEPVIPIFGLRAYAANGEPIYIENIGDRVSAKNLTSDLFPGRQVYMLDVYLEGYNLPNTAPLDDKLTINHKGTRYLKPGESDEWLSVQWLTMDRDGVIGYRLVGWCDGMDQIALCIRGEDGRILYEKEIRIHSAEEGYEIDVRISYSYRDNRTTDELIELVMHQDYSTQVMFSSDLQQRGLRSHTGFQELVKRPDAPSKLLALFIRSQHEKGIFALDKIFIGMSGDNDWLLNILLTWDEVWEGLTPREQALALGHGCSRLMFDYESKRFGNDLGVLLQISAPDTADADSILEVSYNGITTTKEDDHIRMFPTIGTDENGSEIYGWAVCVCFKDKTEVTFTVRDGAGNILQQEIYLVSRIEYQGGAHYEIEKLTP